MSLMVWLLGTAWALSPPTGWTQVSADRAQRVVGQPSQGELLELLQPSGTGAPTELSLRLVEAELAVQQSSVDGAGGLNLVLTDGRVGRARWDGDGERWLVVLVAPMYAPKLDPDALLLAASAAAPAPAGGVWGSSDGSAPEALDGGADGSPWASDGTGGAGESWVDASQLEVWGRDDALLGMWECSLLMGGSPTRLTFSFQGDGTVRLERKVGGQAEHLSGEWSTRGDQIRLALPGAVGPERYSVVGGTLTFRYDKTRLTLYKQ